jgi:Tfp pilus assembly protein PilF
MRYAVGRLALLLMAAVVAACSTQPLREVTHFFERNGEAQLKQGIKDYEARRLTQASENFQDALDAGLNTADQVTAHKYLAFIACTAKRERQCRAHFRMALELNPEFELTPAEAASPIWAGVFRGAKEGRR